jgi:hypothetical protein
MNFLAHFFTPISKLNVVSQENTGVSLEPTVGIKEFTLFKWETTINNYAGVRDNQTGSATIEKGGTSRPDPDLAKSISSGSNTDAEKTVVPATQRVFRLATHVIIDRTTVLAPGMSFELADDFFISGHLPRDKEIYFPSWDPTKRSLLVKFGSQEPISAGNFQTGQLVPFLNNRAQISDHVSLVCNRIEPGRTMFFEQPGFAMSLAADCEAALWYIERVHVREISKHYFLLFTNGSLGDPR